MNFDYGPTTVSSAGLWPRPWLKLYSSTWRLDPLLASPPSQARKDELDDQCDAPPNISSGFENLQGDLIFAIFSHLKADDLSRAAQVCRSWRAAAADPAHWRRICFETWPGAWDRREVIHCILEYRSLKRMFLVRPRMRFDCVYVVRQQYIRVAGARIHLVRYFRMMKFWPDGVCMTVTTAEKPWLIAKKLQRDSVEPTNMNRGTYSLFPDRCEVTVETPISNPKYPRMRLETILWNLDLDESHPGARDILHVTAHYSMDKETGEAVNFKLNHFTDKPFVAIQTRNFRQEICHRFPEEPDALANWDRFYKNGKLDMAAVYRTNIPVEDEAAG